MKVNIDSKGDFEYTTRWLRNMRNLNPKHILQTLGEEGVANLRASTPSRTGGTAAGWLYAIATSGQTWELYFYNAAYPHLNVNIAKLIDSGHGTRTGGYVPPRPYIRAAVAPVFANFGKYIDKEVRR